MEVKSDTHVRLRLTSAFVCAFSAPHAVYQCLLLCPTPPVLGCGHINLSCNLVSCSRCVFVMSRMWYKVEFERLPGKVSSVTICVISSVFSGRCSSCPSEP